MIRELGITASLGVLAAFAITILLIPAAVLSFRTKRWEAEADGGAAAKAAEAGEISRASRWAATASGWSAGPSSSWRSRPLASLGDASQLVVDSAVLDQFDPESGVPSHHTPGGETRWRPTPRGDARPRGAARRGQGLRLRRIAYTPPSTPSLAGRGPPRRSSPPRASRTCGGLGSRRRRRRCLREAVRRRRPGQQRYLVSQREKPVGPTWPRTEPSPRRRSAPRCRRPRQPSLSKPGGDR